MDAARRKSRVAWLSVASNSTLVAGKLVVGLIIGSVSVLSEAIHSGVDLIAALIALFAVRAASRPPDRQHPYGHGKFENISGTVEALLIFGAAAWIIYEAVHKLLARQPVGSVGLGVAVMAVSAAVNYAVSAMLFKVGKETDSIALQADGWHLRTDVWTSAGVMGGLLVIAVGGWLLPAVPLWWVDPLAAMAVALLILRAAWKLTAESLRDVVDVALPAEEVAAILADIRSHEEVLGVHGLRTRKSGGQRFIEFHMLVDAAMPTGAAHQITEEITQQVEGRFPGSSVTAHVEPCDGSCPPECVEGCRRSLDERQAMQAAYAARRQR